MRTSQYYYLFLLLGHVMTKETNSSGIDGIIHPYHFEASETPTYGADPLVTSIDYDARHDNTILTLDTTENNQSRRQLDTFEPSAEATNPPTRSPTKSPIMLPSPVPPSPGINQWYISKTGPTTEEPISSDIILISIPFKTSNKNSGAVIFEEDCRSPINGKSYFDVGTTTPISDQEGNLIEFNTTIKMNVTALSDSRYWNPFEDGRIGGWVDICVETYLSFTGMLNLGIEQKVNYLHNKLTVSVVLSASFGIDKVEIGKEEETNEVIRTDYTDSIDAYLCVESDLYQPALGITYNQGDEIMFCVANRSDFLGIIKVDEFVNIRVSQEGVSDYNFMKDSFWNEEITTIRCQNGYIDTDPRVCYAKILALARFFYIDDPPDLTITGSVFVFREGRRLHSPDLRMTPRVPGKIIEEGALVPSHHRVGEEDPDASGNFQLRVSLKAENTAITPTSTVDNSPAHVSGSSGIILISSVVGCSLLGYFAKRNFPIFFGRFKFNFR